MLRSRCRRWHCAPQTLAMKKQQEKALATTECQERPCANCSPNCGALRMTPAAVDGRNNRDTTHPTTVASIILHAFNCPRRILSLGLHYGMLTDGKHKNLAADAKAWHLAGEHRVGEAHVRKRLGAPGGAFREARARQERSAFDATA